MSKKQVMETEQAPKAIGAYSQGIVAGGFLFISGQIPLDPASGQVVPGGIREQVTRVLENVKAVLATQELGLESVVKTTVYLLDLSEFPQMNEVYGRYFGEDAPARAAVQVVALPRGVRVEIDAVAVI